MAVASSSTSTSGSIASMPAMAILCFWPPESMLGAACAYSLMPTAASEASTLFLSSGVGTPKFSGPKATSSSTMVVTS